MACPSQVNSVLPSYSQGWLARGLEQHPCVPQGSQERRVQPLDTESSRIHEPRLHVRTIAARWRNRLMS
jgi:hypothetical protein